MSGGKLFDRVVEKEHYSEKEASDTIRPIVDGIKYCHTLGIVHRDLKVMFPYLNSIAREFAVYVKGPTRRNQDLGLRPCSFHEPGTYGNNMRNSRLCGARNNQGRRIRKSRRFLEHRSRPLCSVFYCWVNCRLCGFPPFYAENNQDLFDIIKKGEYDFPSPYWDNISEPAKDLIRNLLVVDITKRYDADKILAHPWIVGEKTPRKQLPNVTSKIREFNAKKEIKVAFFSIIINRN